MKINKQGNVYTLIYIIILVIIVGTVLAVTSMSLKEKQEYNANADKMKQILASVHIPATDEDVADIFSKVIVSTPVVNSEGKITGDNAFEVNVEKQASIKDEKERVLPVYVCDLGEKGIKYILPVYGSGLWGPIWGYVAVDADGSTIYGAYFAHQSETPGLGAEIEKPAFRNQFDNKQIIKDGTFAPIAVVKKGMKAPKNVDYVDAVSGGTITSKGVHAMLDNCLQPYKNFLENLNNKKK